MSTYLISVQICNMRCARNDCVFWVKFDRYNFHKNQCLSNYITFTISTHGLAKTQINMCKIHDLNS